jgi:polar amino acid transport system substrate-binding protein
LALGFLAVAGLSAASAAEAVAIPPVSVDPALKAALPADIQASGIIKLATDAHYPPCESYAEDNVTMVGWEPDLWNAIGQKLGVKVEPTSIDFSGLIPGVQAGRFDMAMECISDTEVREKAVTFVNVSYVANALYTLDSNKIITEDPLSLCGLTTASQQGTTHAQDVDNILTPHCTKNGKPAVKNLQFPSADATLLALYSGRVDFVVNDAASTAEIKAKAPHPIRVYPADIIGRRYSGIILRKDNDPLAQAVLGAVKSLVADGTYDKIMDKWDLGLLKLHDPGINLGTTRPLPVPAP